MPREAPLHLRGHTPETLAEAVPGLPLAVARRVQHRVLGEDCDHLSGVPGLSKPLARELTGEGRLDRLQVLDRRRSAVDPFVKYLFRGRDGCAFEAVRIPLDRPRYSVCVSSQAGCALGCAFCETGRLGLLRQLEVWEMVEQVLTVRRESPERPVTGVVFQGQGEPLHNYDNVMQAARVLRDPCGPRIGSDRITISTVGLLPQIERYTEEGHRYRLILSLTSAFSEKRARLVPVTARYGVPELAAAMRRHAERRGGPVSLGWVLISGFNTGADEAAELARLFRGVPVRVSVIDVNDPSGRFRQASDEDRGRFLAALSEHGLGFVRRYSGGPDIHAACGMLASRAQGGALHAPPPAGAP
ncbi:MAG TPA: radical SAM protein [Vicinamibacteria bacterium]|nr:radical SAM protein [Vicinamibacteria bacterium]